MKASDANPHCVYTLFIPYWFWDIFALWVIHNMAVWRKPFLSQRLGHLNCCRFGHRHAVVENLEICITYHQAVHSFSCRDKNAKIILHCCSLADRKRQKFLMSVSLLCNDNCLGSGWLRRTIQGMVRTTTRNLIVFLWKFSMILWPKWQHTMSCDTILWGLIATLVVGTAAF